MARWARATASAPSRFPRKSTSASRDAMGGGHAVSHRGCKANATRELIALRIAFSMSRPRRRRNGVPCKTAGVTPVLPPTSTRSTTIAARRDVSAAWTSWRARQAEPLVERACCTCSAASPVPLTSNCAAAPIVRFWNEARRVNFNGNLRSGRLEPIVSQFTQGSCVAREPWRGIGSAQARLVGFLHIRRRTTPHPPHLTAAVARIHPYACDPGLNTRLEGECSQRRAREQRRTVVGARLQQLQL
eukprot:scaffold246504_cov30-Tisochrysis_lutea.AAC.5